MKSGSLGLPRSIVDVVAITGRHHGLDSNYVPYHRCWEIYEQFQITTEMKNPYLIVRWSFA